VNSGANERPQLRAVFALTARSMPSLGTVIDDDAGRTVSTVSAASEFHPRAAMGHLGWFAVYCSRR